MEFDLSKLKVRNQEDVRIYSILKDGNEREIDNIDGNEVVGYRARASPLILKLPQRLNNELAYIIGAFLGDGCIKRPLKRKKGGYYNTLDFTGGLKSVENMSKRINTTFGYNPKIIKNKRRENSWFFNINSIVVYRFFTDIIGFKPGKKSGNMPWFEIVCLNKEIFKNFLAGLIDTDGYVSSKYACIVQKDKQFLEKVREKSKEILDIQFKEVGINRKIDNKVVGWWIILNGKELKKLSSLPLQIKKYNGPGAI